MKNVAFVFALLSMCTAIGTGLEQIGHAQVDPKSIDGVVRNRNGQTPEAGVWVIAETKSLPTPYRKIVVTNDAGRFVVPDLPNGDYLVWVRGYGLKDSDPVKAAPGSGNVILEVSSASNAVEAAQIYPASYWLSLFETPSKQELPKAYSSQAQWIAAFKVGCHTCHQIGGELTRLFTKPEQWDAVWRRAGTMSSTADQLGREVLAKHLAAWASRIAAGELPPAPPRPAGVERNVVLTQWEWGQPNSFLHGTRSTDKRNPRLYPYGKVYGVDFGQDMLWALDPVKNTVSSWKIPVRPGFDDPQSFQSWVAYRNPGAPNSVNLDDKGVAWITMGFRPRKDKPTWAHHVIASDTEDREVLAKLAKLYDEGGPHRQLIRFDIKTETFVLVDTAYEGQHLEFDQQGRLWSGADPVGMGMFDPSQFDSNDPDGTAERAQKLWMSLDTKTEKLIGAGGYGVVVNPVDQTIWRAVPTETEVAAAGGQRENRGGPGPHLTGLENTGNKIVKFDPKTRKFTEYALPPPGRVPRGIDATSDGKIWFGAAGSGHLGSFDPKTEQFTYWESPGPKLKGTGPETGSADMHYYMWVDRFNTLGLGDDMVILNGTDSDALLVFDPVTEKFTVIRMPYPRSFFHRALDGRIDDPNSGWKGRGLWVDYAGDPIRFTEKTHMGSIVHVQVRPDPLAH